VVDHVVIFAKREIQVGAAPPAAAAAAAAVVLLRLSANGLQGSVS
jgi:hypothetical protein